MKEYPSILDFEESKHNVLESVVLFDKIDGSNIRIGFNKDGFSKIMGTRHEYIKENTPFKIVYSLFKEKEELLKDILLEFYPKKEMTIFFELHGVSSQFGRHNFDEPLTLTLIDVFEHKKGFIKPLTFREQFLKVGIPKIIHIGMLTSDIVQGVRHNIYDLQEGVIIKNMEYGKGFYNLNYRKLKTNNWYEELRKFESARLGR